MNRAPGTTGRIQPGPRWEYPDRCGKPEPAHRPHHDGDTRPRGYHDRQCQVPSAHPTQYPECGWIDGHDAGHCYQLRIGTPECQAAATRS